MRISGPVRHVFRPWCSPQIRTPDEEVSLSASATFPTCLTGNADAAAAGHEAALPACTACLDGRDYGGRSCCKAICPSKGPNLACIKSRARPRLAERCPEGVKPRPI